MGNAVGFVALFLLVGLTVKLFHLGSQAPPLVWFAAYLVLAVLGWQSWHDKHAPRTTRGWVSCAIGSVLLGAASFIVDISFGQHTDPNLSMLAAAQKTGGMFGFGLTVTVFPAMFFVSVAGMARSAYLAMQAKDL